MIAPNETELKGVKWMRVEDMLNEDRQHARCCDARSADLQLEGKSWVSAGD